MGHVDMVYHDQYTISKMLEAIKGDGALSEESAWQVIVRMQSAGILFREFIPRNEKGEWTHARAR